MAKGDVCIPTDLITRFEKSKHRSGASAKLLLYFMGKIYADHEENDVFSYEQIATDIGTSADKIEEETLNLESDGWFLIEPMYGDRIRVIFYTGRTYGK